VKKESYTIYEAGKRDLYNPFESEGIDDMIRDEESEGSWHVNLTNLERENEFNYPEKWSPSKEGQRYPFMSKKEYESGGFPDNSWWVKTLAFIKEVNSKYQIHSQGYDGWSKSNRALEAEKEGKYPITQAAQILSKKLGWPVTKTKALLLTLGTKEWHHTSKFYNETKYYDISDKWIKENKKDIDSFQYNPSKQDNKEIWFKCWNFEKTNDLRKWDWTLTNREGNNCYKFDKVKPKIQKFVDEAKEKLKTEKNQTQIRILNEKIARGTEILTSLAQETLAFIKEVNSKYIIKVTAQDYEILYHGSNNPNLTKVNELNEINDLFGGIFASYDYDAAYSHGKYMYEIQLKQDEMLEDIPDTPQVLSIIENETEIRDSDYEEGKKDEKYIQDLDLLYSVVGLEKNLFALDNWIDFRDFDEYKNAEGEDRWHIAHDIEERIQKRICELLGKDDLGYAGWETQRIRGVIAKKLGYKAVSTKDEHGVSYLILPSVELKKIKGE